MSKIKIPSRRFLSGIDISPKQLKRNNLLDEKIFGNKQNYRFKENEFDLIICKHVLEHIKRPKNAINDFIYSIKEGGVIIASSNALSIKGLITKFTLHSFHVFVYRYFYERKYAGKDDTAPFKTHRRLIINPKSLIKFEQKSGIEYICNFYNDALNGWVGISVKNKSWLLFNTLKFLKRLSSILSFNLISNSEFILVFKKEYLNSIKI